MATSPRTQQAQFLQRRLARRAGASSVTRLADQYQSQIQSLTSQYETEFSRYQEQVNSLMQPYEEAIQRYQDVDLPAFDSYIQDYDQYLSRLSEYQPFVTESATTQQRAVSVFNAIPAQEWTLIRRGGYQRGDYNWATGTYGPDVWLPDEYGFVTPPGRWETENVTDYVIGGDTLTKAQFEKLLDERDGFVDSESGNNVSFTLRNLEAQPTFDREKPPEPVAPTAQKIDEFDSSQFDERRAQLQEGFQRDIAARRGARISAVRRSSRTLLSGAQ
jgi:hypothetical protein